MLETLSAKDLIQQQLCQISGSLHFASWRMAKVMADELRAELRKKRTVSLKETPADAAKEKTRADLRRGQVNAGRQNEGADLKPSFPNVRE